MPTMLYFLAILGVLFLIVNSFSSPPSPFSNFSGENDYVYITGKVVSQHTSNSMNILHLNNSLTLTSDSSFNFVNKSVLAIGRLESFAGKLQLKIDYLREL